MKRIDKVIFGFTMSVCAFIITVMVSGYPDFMEMNPVLSILFNEFNNYYAVLIYALMWAAILTMYEFMNNKLNKYCAEYTANFILFIGFFDLLHNIVVILNF